MSLQTTQIKQSASTLLRRLCNGLYPQSYQYFLMLGDIASKRVSTANEVFQVFASSMSIRPSPAFARKSHFRSHKEHRVVASVGYVAKNSNRIECHSSFDSSVKHNCGEDAFFITTNLKSKKKTPVKTVAAMGIADGVGGYAKLGIDSSLMAWKLMQNAEDYISEKHGSNICPRLVIKHAYDTICMNNQVQAGGSTACVLLLTQNVDPETNTPTGPLQAQSANLGDSGFMIVRGQQIIFKSPEQTHYFNAPYQLSIPPQGYTEVFQDDPMTAQLQDEPIDLQEGDFIILATDGFFDNVFSDSAVQLLLQQLNKENKEGACTNHPALVDNICKTLVDFTHKIATDEQAETPFAKYARENNKYYKGGKMDDITIMVAKIC